MILFIGMEGQPASPLMVTPQRFTQRGPDVSRARSERRRLAPDWSTGIEGDRAKLDNTQPIHPSGSLHAVYGFNALQGGRGDTERKIDSFVYVSKTKTDQTHENKTGSDKFTRDEAVTSHATLQRLLPVVLVRTLQQDSRAQGEHRHRSSAKGFGSSACGCSAATWRNNWGASELNSRHGRNLIKAEIPQLHSRRDQRSEHGTCIQMKMPRRQEHEGRAEK